MATAKKLAGTVSNLQRRRNLKQRVWRTSAAAAKRGTKKG